MPTQLSTYGLVIRWNLCHLDLAHLHQLSVDSKIIPQENGNSVWGDLGFICLKITFLYVSFFGRKASEIARILSETSEPHESRNSVSFSVWLEEYGSVVSELASVFTLMFYVLLSWASTNKTPEAHLLHLRHFNRILNKALAPQRELLNNIFMDIETVICTDCMDLCAWEKRDLMDVIYSKHVRLIPLFIDGNNLLIIEIQFHPYNFIYSTTLFIFILWWFISIICTLLVITFLQLCIFRAILGLPPTLKYMGNHKFRSLMRCFRFF